MDTPPAPQQSSPAPAAAPGGKRYTVGTLSYTAGGLVVLFGLLLLGDFAFAMRERSAHPVVQLAMQHYGASATYMSWVLAVVPPAFGMMLGPIVSYRSDRHRGPRGRRIPYLLWTTPITFLAMVGLAFCPQLGASAHGWLGESSPGLNILILGFFGLFYVFFEFGCLASLVLFGALVNDVVPRSMIGRFYGLFRAVSLGAGMIFNYWLLSWSETHFTLTFLGISLFFGVGYTLMCLLVKEGEYPPPQPVDPARRGFLPAAGTYLRECFSDSYYRWVFVAMLIATLVFMPFNTFSVPYAKSIQVPMEIYGRLIAGSYLVSLVLAYPLGWLVDRFHPLRIGIVTMAIYACSTTYGWFFVTDTATFGAALVAHTILSGAYFTATAGLGAFLFPRSKFGQFASAANIVVSSGSIVLGLVIGPVLDASGKDYRLTFLFGLFLCLGALVPLAVVYRKFMRLGGPANYVAPGAEDGR